MNHLISVTKIYKAKNWLSKIIIATNAIKKNLNSFSKNNSTETLSQLIEIIRSVFVSSRFQHISFDANLATHYKNENIELQKMINEYLSKKYENEFNCCNDLFQLIKKIFVSLPTKKNEELIFAIMCQLIDNFFFKFKFPTLI